MPTSDLMRHPERYEHHPTCDYPRDRQQPCTCFLAAESDQQRVPSCADLAAPVCGKCEDCQPAQSAS